MSSLALKLHPDSRSVAITGINVDVTRTRVGGLMLIYSVSGATNDLLLPATAASVRCDELWRHTCFEAFVRPLVGEAYYEFNFAPSTQWAAYRFDGYRSAMRAAAGIGPPQIEVQSASDRYAVKAVLELGDWTLAGDAVWRMGLSAIIEEAGGHKSYWALAHPPGKPDFHHADCFALELPQALRP